MPTPCCRRTTRASPSRPCCAPGPTTSAASWTPRARRPFEKAVARAYGARVGLGGTPHHVGGEEGPAETAYLGVLPARPPGRGVGLFDEGIKRGQDWELNRRLRAAGGTVWFTPRARGHLPAAAEPAQARPADSSRPASGAANSPAGSRPPTAPLLRAARSWCSAWCSASCSGIVGLVRPLLGAAPWLLLGFVVPAVYLLFVIVATIAVAARATGFARRCWFLVVLPCIHFGWGIGFVLGFLKLTQQHHGTHGKVTMASPDGGTTAPADRRIAELRAVAQPPEVRGAAQRRALDRVALPARHLAVPHLVAAEDAHLGERRDRADDPRRLVDRRRAAHPGHLRAPLLALVLGQLQMLVDCCDGEVARWRGTSLAGRRLPRQGRALHDRGADPDRARHPGRRLPVRRPGRLPLDHPRLRRSPSSSCSTRRSTTWCTSPAPTPGSTKLADTHGRGRAAASGSSPRCAGPPASCRSTGCTTRSS